MLELPKNADILIVDDHRETREALKAALSHLDPDIVECGSGEEALRVLLERPFAVILLDIRLPGMDGFELAEAIRTRPSTRETPIIFLTGLIREEPYIQRGYALGAVDYLVKPINVENLRAKVGVFVSLARQRKLLEAQSREIASANARLQSRVEERTAELARANEELRQSEARFRRLAENAPDVIFRYSEGPETGFDFVSPAVEGVIGYTPEEHYENPDLWATIVHPEDRERLDALLRAEGPPAGDAAVQALRLRHRSGSTVWVEPRVAGTGTGAAVVVEGILRDVTRRRELQEQLLQAQRMESVARLAGGVAHDFNNMLTIIQSFCALLLEDLAPDDPGREYAGRIKDAAERSARLTRQMLTFSRRQQLEISSVDLNGLITGLDEILARTIGEDIEFVLHLDDALARVRADAAQLEQVLMNLVVNARDAMPHGGTLLVETQNVELDAEAAGLAEPEAGPGRYVRISVTDTGLGMDTDTRSQLFEPFFTTKASGRGTGLGLTTVYGIVKQMKGFVRVRSEPGNGTTFDILLPAEERVPEAAVMAEAEGAGNGRGDGVADGMGTPDGASAPGATRNPLQGRGTILLVEDEADVREAARQALAGAGYAVLEAGDGAEALDLAAGSARKIDLLLTDVVMPRLGGAELAARLREQWPGLPVLYMSGYTDGKLRPTEELDPGMSFLPKPWVPSQLLDRVRAALERGRVGGTPAGGGGARGRRTWRGRRSPAPDATEGAP